MAMPLHSGSVIGLTYRISADRISRRLRVHDPLEQDATHPTAEDLYDTLRRDHPSLSLSTVYQTLDAFIRSGLCRRVSGPGNRLRVDGTPQDHEHAVCHLCGAIFDVNREHVQLQSPPGHLSNGLMVMGIRFEYEVICAACQEAPGRVE